MVQLLFACLGFLFPLALYCLFLAYLNARPQATVIPGTWDFVGVLFATCGFWLVGGPMIIDGMYYKWLPALLMAGRGAEGGGVSWRWLVWAMRGIYFLAVVGGVALLIRRRSRVTVIYNCETALFLDVLTAALHNLGLEASHQRSRFTIGPAAGSSTPADAKPGSVAGPLEVHVDPFSSLHHVTLRWTGDNDPLRRDIDNELARLLTKVEAAPSSVAGWMLTASCCLIVFMLFGLGLLLFLDNVPR